MFSYIVRCNFSDPVKEKPWNDWYSGPKLGQMLSKPYFRSTQRFRRSDGTGRNYLALWILESPEAFNTHEYKSDWGFFEWRPYIIDWSRDLFAGSGLVEDSFAVSPQGALHVVSFDGLSKDDAEKAQKAYAFVHPNMTWMTIAGLDKHTEIIGVEALDELPRSWRPSNAAVGAQEAIYLPISDFHRASSYRKVD
ncbi:MAG: hypothetical protein ACTHLY_08425 [Pseudolabrys sp.]